MCIYEISGLCIRLTAADLHGRRIRIKMVFLRYFLFTASPLRNYVCYQNLTPPQIFLRKQETMFLEYM